MIQVPNRRTTMIGMAAFRGDPAKVETAINDMVPLKYEVALQDREGNYVIGHIVTYLELPDWLEWKNFILVSIEKTPELALSSERTRLR